MLFESQTCPFKKIHLQMFFAQGLPFCSGLNLLTHWGLMTPYGDKDLGQQWLR